MIVILAFLLLWKDFFRSLKIVKDNFDTLSQRQLSKKGYGMSPWTYKPFLALIPGVTIICPFYIIIACMRIATDRVVGTDTTITSLTIIATVALFVTNFFMHIHIVRSLVISFSSDSRFQNLTVLHDKLYLFATIFVIIFTVLPQAPLLFFPQFDGDGMRSPSLAILLLKNVGTIIYVFLLGLTAVIMENRVKDLSSQGAPSSKSKVAKILEGFAAISKDSKKKVAISVIIYVVFSLPPLWGMQNYIYAVIYIVYATGNATPGRYFLTARSGEEKISSNSGKVASSEDRSHGATAVIAIPGGLIDAPVSDSYRDLTQVESKMVEMKSLQSMYVGQTSMRGLEEFNQDQE